MCATEIGGISQLPNAIAIIGGGVIGVEYATVFAQLGLGVSLLCKENQFVPFLEKEIRDTLKRMMKRNHILFVEDDVASIQLEEDIIKVQFFNF